MISFTEDVARTSIFYQTPSGSWFCFYWVVTLGMRAVFSKLLLKRSLRPEVANLLATQPLWLLEFEKSYRNREIILAWNEIHRGDFPSILRPFRWTRTLFSEQF